MDIVGVYQIQRSLQGNEMVNMQLFVLNLNLVKWHLR